MTTEYTVHAHGETRAYADLSLAIRDWDRSTYLAPSPGGIAVRTWSGDVMVRDGWILHVHESGVVYLNPNVSP